MAPRLSSSIGKKLIMAISGLLMFGWLCAHLSGNLLIFAGRDAFNAYAQKLKELGPLLWAGRLGMIVILVVHVAMAIRLSIENRKAAGGGYAVERVNKASSASLTMLASGVFILAFLCFHLAHLTFGWTLEPEVFHGVQHVEGVGARHDVYSVVLHSFTNPTTGALYTMLYLAAMAGLAFHLYHAINSSLQTFGFHCERVRRVTIAIGMALALGFSSVPLALATGVSGPGGGTSDGGAATTTPDADQRGDASGGKQ